jgi:hypothetical protein
MQVVITILRNVFFEFWGLFGVFLIGGGLLTFISKWLNNAFDQFIAPRLGFYLFGVIGVPVHELSHAFFCWVFRHKINDIKWFDPHAHDASHGSVSHSYNPWNLYHRVGHFFIGLGPTIIGPAILAGAFYFLVPTARQVILSTHHIGSLGDFHLYIIEVLRALFNRHTLTSPGFYVFAYLSVAICSQIELSPADLKQVAIGAIPLALILIVAASISWVLHGAWHAYTLSAGSALMKYVATLFVFSALLATVSLIFFWALLTVINILFGRPPINPFSQS